MSAEPGVDLKKWLNDERRRQAVSRFERMTDAELFAELQHHIFELHYLTDKLEARDNER
jgi:hypothetical protein